MNALQLFDTIASEMGYCDLMNTGRYIQYIKKKRVIRLCLMNVFNLRLLEIENVCKKYEGFGHSNLINDKKVLENAKFTKDTEFLNLYAKAIKVSKKIKQNIKEESKRFDFDELEQLIEIQ